VSSIHQQEGLSGGISHREVGHYQFFHNEIKSPEELTMGKIASRRKIPEKIWEGRSCNLEQLL
jgi:hypothetical protein